MKTLRPWLALVLALLCLVPVAARPTYVSIGGIILTDEVPEHRNDRLPYTPVPGVLCVVSGEKVTEKEHERDHRQKDPDRRKYECVSDEKGFFHFDGLAKGDYTVTFTKAGYPQQSKSATVTGDPMPDPMRITMNHDGSTFTSGTPTGPGTVYVAFRERADDLTNPDGSDKILNNFNSFTRAVMAGWDPIGGIDPKLGGSNKNTFLEQCGLSFDPDTLMMYPPGAPGRTSFERLEVHPFWLCFNHTGKVLYVVSGDSSIQLLDTTADNRLITNLPAPGRVVDLCPSLDGRFMLATTIGQHAVMVIDQSSNLPIATLPCALAPRAAVMTGGRVYAVEGDNASGTVEVLDLSSGRTVGHASVGANPVGITLTPDGRKLFVANSGGASVSVLDAASLTPLGRIAVGVSPTRVAMSPDGQRAYVTNRGSDSVTVIDVPRLSVIATIRVAHDPVGVAVNRDGSRVFVTCRAAGTVLMLDGKTGTLLHATTPQPHSSPFGVAVRP